MNFQLKNLLSSKLNKSFLIFLFCLSANVVISQEKEADHDLDVDHIQVLEDYFQDRELNEAFDFNTLYEELEYFKRKPINLNKTDSESLREIGLFNEIQISSLKEYLSKNGDLISIYELQAIPYFDLKTIYAIRPYVTVSGDLDDINTPLLQMLSKGTNEYFIRVEKVLEDQLGFTNEQIPDRNDFFKGIPFDLYSRFKHNYENRLSYGFTLENDAGEELFKGSNSNGFDFYSGHFYLKDLNSLVKTVAIGDYTVSFGQGLIVHSGFGRGKSSAAVDLRKNRRVIKPYTSVDENLFNRGAAVTLGFAKIEMSLFASSLKRDANILQADSLDLDQEELEFSSLQNTGFHRTNAEIIDEDAITLNNVGLNFRFDNERNLKLGLNGLYTTFDSSFERNLRPDNIFAFNTDQLLNVSVDYSYTYKNLHLFGETAVSNNGGIASLNTALFGLNQKIYLAIAHRDYGVRYQALNANAFGETLNANNERGIYLGLEVQPSYNWKFSAYVDQWKHPWLRFAVDSPSVGKEYLFKLLYQKKRKLNMYLQYRKEIKDRNGLRDDEKTNFLDTQVKDNIRFHVSNKVSKTLELRNRIDFTLFDFRGSVSRGLLIYQDIIYKPKDFPVSITSRIAYFDTDDFNSRAFAFENDLLYAFSIPIYFNKGTRYYINLRYRANRHLTFEARIAQTHWLDEPTIGSGLNLIEGQNRTEVKGQVRLKF